MVKVKPIYVVRVGPMGTLMVDMGVELAMVKVLVLWRDWKGI